MKKVDVQQRVLQHGKPIQLSKFTWDEKTNTFSSEENNLVIEFTTEYDCTFTTGSNCTFTTGSNCTFKTWYDCTFTTGSNCSFTTWSNCTFKTWSDCVIVNRNVFEVITPKKGDVIQICPHGIEGHLVNGLYKGKPHIVSDGILSKIVNQKGNIFTVINHGEEKKSYIVKDGDTYAHGKTVKAARDDLTFKLMEKDVSQFENMPLDTVKKPDEWALIYRAITGACELGVEYFLKSKQLKKTYTLSEILAETKGSYGHERFKEVVTGK